MARHCETFDHTADVGLDARADTLGELLAAMVEGLADVLCDRASVRPAARRVLRVRAENRDDLAHDLLSGVLGAFDVDRFLPAEAKVTVEPDGTVSAELAGETYDPARHELKTEIKAVTYHQLRIARDADEWTGRVILDL